MPDDEAGGPVDPAAQREADARRQDRERVERAAAKEAARAERDRVREERAREKEQREREKAARAAEREAERRRAEQERAVREVEQEAAQAEREAERAAADAQIAAERAARQVERARLRAERLAEQEAREEQEPDDLPPALAVLWRTPVAGRRGPRPGLTLDGITRSAVDLADAEGLGAVSMARVAERLGVTTMALYRYVRGKDDLLALMLDAVVGEAAGPGEGSPTPAGDDGSDADAPPAWRRALERWCRDQLAMAVAHPWSVQPAVVQAVPGPARVAFIDRGLAALEGTPLTWAERAAVVGRLSLHVLDEGRLLAAGEVARRARAAAGAAPGGGAVGPAGGAAGTSGVAAGAASAADGATHPALLDYGTLLRAVADPRAHPVLHEALARGAFDGAPTGPAPAAVGGAAAVGEAAAGVGEADDADFGLRLVLDGVAALMARAARR